MNPVPHPSNEPPVSMASAVLIPSAQALKVLDTRGTLSPYPTRITPAGDDYRKLGYRPDSWIVVVEFSDSRRRRKRRNFRHLESPDRFPSRIHKENSTAAAFINNCLTLRGKLSELSNLLKCLTNTLHTTIQKLTKLSNVERKSCDSCGSCCGCFRDSKSLAAQGIAVVAIVFPPICAREKMGCGAQYLFFNIRNTRKLPQTIVPFDFIDKYYLSNYRKTIATIAGFRAGRFVDRHLLKRVGIKARLIDADRLPVSTDCVTIRYAISFVVVKSSKRIPVVFQPKAPASRAFGRSYTTPPVKGPYKRSDRLRAGATPETCPFFGRKNWVDGLTIRLTG